MNKQTEIAKDYQQSVSISTNKKKVFEALTREISQWWGQVDQPAHEVGDVFKITFGEDSYWKFKIIDLIESENVIWECVESHQDHNIEGMDEEWLGSKLHWKILEKTEAVEVRFLHQGLVPHGVCYGACSAAWDFYITDSLKNYLETGEGKPEEM